jgi:uncharacterized protein (TIGR03382 family)
MASAVLQIVFKHRLLAIGAAATLAGLTASRAQAEPIFDPSYFNGVTSSLINFETDGAGNPITLIPGGRRAMPANAYASEGIAINGIGCDWSYDGNAAFHAALVIAGSPNISFPSSLCNTVTLTFTPPVLNFGMFVVNNRTADPNGPLFIARDVNGNIIETAQFEAKFIDGTIQTANTTADYGFMGIGSTTPIASVILSKTAATFDNLRFGPHVVPAPGALALGAAGALVLLRRRR